jgi:YHS domain-containing protein
MTTSLHKKLFYTVTLFLALTVTSCGLIPSQADSSLDAVNVDESTLAIQGYDPVAYFTLNAPTKGKSDFTANYEGATYWFSSQEHKTLFVNEPAKYAPQFGGFCAFGVSKEKKYPIEPDAFSVVDGKLYLNLNKKVTNIWSKNSAELITDANNNWEVIANTPVDEL